MLPIRVRNVVPCRCDRFFFFVLLPRRQPWQHYVSVQFLCCNASQEGWCTTESKVGAEAAWSRRHQMDTPCRGSVRASERKVQPQHPAIEWSSGSRSRESRSKQQRSRRTWARRVQYCRSPPRSALHAAVHEPDEHRFRTAAVHHHGSWPSCGGIPRNKQTQQMKWTELSHSPLFIFKKSKAGIIRYKSIHTYTCWQDSGCCDCMACIGQSTSHADHLSTCLPKIVLCVCYVFGRHCWAGFLWSG